MTVDQSEKNKNARLPHLDALRGVAALLVLIGHCLLATGKTGFVPGNGEIFSSIPVTFFFLLSGYVLSASILTRGQISPAGIICYYLRRIFRLYPAAFISLVFGIIIARYYHMPHAGECTEWMRKTIIKAHYSGFDTKSLIGYVLLTNIKPNPVLWTIQVEFICSIILPLLIALAVAVPKLNIPIAGALLAILALKVPMISSMACFYLGFLCWNWRGFLRLIPKKWINLVVITFILAITLANSIKGYAVPGTLMTAVVFGFITANRDGVIYNILMWKPFQYLGKISYSFYLVHLPIIIILYSFFCLYLNFGSGEWKTSVALVVTATCITIITATVLERVIETPFNKIGHSFSKKLTHLFSNL